MLRLTNAGAVAPVLSLVNWLGGNLIRQLPIINAVAVDLPNVALPLVAGNPLVVRASRWIA